MERDAGTPRLGVFVERKKKCYLPILPVEERVPAGVYGQRLTTGSLEQNFIMLSQMHNSGVVTRTTQSGEDMVVGGLSLSGKPSLSSRKTCTWNSSSTKRPTEGTTPHSKG